MPVNYDVTEDLVTGTTAIVDYVTNKDSQNKNKKNEVKSNNKFGIYITNRNGKQTSNNSKSFFNLLNSLVGNVFTVDNDTGELSVTSEQEFNSLEANNSTSKSLAELIAENIGDNAKQKIILRVDKNIKKIFFDSFNTGEVDLDDFIILSDKVFQATLIYHFLYERINTENYETVKRKFDDTEFNNGIHKTACEQELKILKEMGKNPTYPKREELPPISSTTYTEYFFVWGGGVLLSAKHNYKKSKIYDVKFTM